MTGFGKFFKERTDIDASELESAREVERVVEAEELLAYDFLVSCPGEDQYQVGIGEHIRVTMPTVKELGDGTKVLYHLDLGQEAPPDRPNFRGIAYDLADILRQWLTLGDGEMSAGAVLEVLQKFEEVIDARGDTIPGHPRTKPDVAVDPSERGEHPHSPT